MNKNPSKNKHVFFVFTISIILLFTIACSMACKNNDDSNTESADIATQIVFVNDIPWSVTYNKASYEIKEINYFFQEKEQSSKYYDTLAYQYGDANVFVFHSYAYKGIPIGNDWYSIELTEIAQDSKESTNILHKSTIRYEEKLILHLIQSADPTLRSKANIKLILYDYNTYPESREVIVTNKNIISISPRFNPTNNDWDLDFTFDAEGNNLLKNIFIPINFNKSLALYVDDEYLIAPTFNSFINFEQLTFALGYSSEEQAKDYAHKFMYGEHRPH